MVKILTSREKQIINKKIKGISLTQNESNILSKSVRPKLKEISNIDAQKILNKIEYNQKAKSIEKKIKKIILANVPYVDSIIIYGSAVQNNYKNYNDIDVLIITKRKAWNSTGDKYEIIINLIKLAKTVKLILDIQIIDKSSLYIQYPRSPSLIYQLKDHKIIYGSIKIPNKIELSKLDMRMKLDWSDIDDEESEGKEIYQSLRNTILVKLLLKKIVSNESLNENVDKELGEAIIKKLKNNTASKWEKKFVLKYIKQLSENIDNNIKEAKWEKIVI